MKYKIGDKVRFLPKGCVRIPVFKESEPLPQELISHGSTELGTQYEQDGAEVIGVYEPLNLVQWADKTGKIMRLGFIDNVLELDKSVAPIPEYEADVEWDEIKSRPK